MFTLPPAALFRFASVLQHVHRKVPLSPLSASEFGMTIMEWSLGDFVEYGCVKTRHAASNPFFYPPYVVPSAIPMLTVPV